MCEVHGLIVENGGGGLDSIGKRNDYKAGESLIALILRSNREERAKILAIA
jgi:hypothetical protein